MSTSTANWSLPTRTWKRLIQDYALVSFRATFIQRELRNHDRFQHPHYVNFQDFLKGRFVHNYSFAQCGGVELVYADVDQGNEAHHKVVGSWAEEKEAEVEDESVAGEKKKLVEAAKGKFHFMSGAMDKKKAEGKDQEGSGKAGKPRAWTDLMVLSELRHRVSEDQSWINEYIMRLSSRTAKEAVLQILSEQSRSKTVRPVMLLLDMVDSCQSTKASETTGWVTGYDFLENVIIIKPFLSKEGHHPLGETWFGTVAEDGVAFRGSPEELLKLVGFHDVDAEKHTFSQIIRIEAVNWMMRYRKVLALNFDGSAELWQNIQDRKDRLKREMKDIEFHNKVKAKGEEKLEGAAKTIYEQTMGCLEALEADFRYAAVHAKERGEVKEMDNMVAFYDRTMADLKSLMEDPGRGGYGGS
ncbi:hypothetical protein MMC08_002586 [Hypocenomyce scalaris]|nr:hypothetical protein [Hypocenomyce scalaris]